MTEERAKESRNVYDLELLTKFWLVLYSAVRREALDETATLLSARTATLTAALERLSQEHHRASTALQARTLLPARAACLDPAGPAEPILHELENVVGRSEGLVGYPLQPLAEIVGELGEVLGDLAVYNELFETVVGDDRSTCRRGGRSARYTQPRCAATRRRPSVRSNPYAWQGASQPAYSRKPSRSRACTLPVRERLRAWGSSGPHAEHCWSPRQWRPTIFGRTKTSRPRRECATTASSGLNCNWGVCPISSPGTNLIGRSPACSPPRGMTWTGPRAPSITSTRSGDSASQN